MKTLTTENSKEESLKRQEPNEDHLGVVIKRYREKQGKRSVDLAKEAEIDPRTLAAIETGRIRNPSMRNIQMIAKALGISPAEFFWTEDLQNSADIYHGSQKGEFCVDAPEKGYRLISFIPMVPEFFIGKALLNAGALLNGEQLHALGKVFIQVIFGKLTITLCGRVYRLKEGSHFLLNGQIPYMFENESLRECSFLLMTTPSFLAARI